MRRARYTIGCLTLLLSSLFAGASARAEKHERKRIERVEITQLEEKWRQAQLAEDISAMDRLLSDEFLGITAAGQVVTKAQQLDRMRTRRLDINRMDISDTKIKISGNLAVVTSLAMIDGTADGKPLRGAFRYTRVYHRVGRDDWKITNFEATRVPGSSSAENLQPAGSIRPAGAFPSSRLASPVKSASLRPPS
jgi:ketosteroid isomerase-like protein